MKKLVLALVLVVLAAAPLTAAEKDHVGHGMNYGNTATAAHQEVIDGVKATFNVQTMKAAMKELGMEMPKGIKDTHHISVAFNDMKTGKAITAGEVRVKVLAPDKSEQAKDMPGMHGHFGADFELAKKGKYGVMCKFKLADGKVRSARFWYEVK